MASGGGTAAPTVSSSTPVDVPRVLTLHDNFFPVPQADAADIPWDEVGPGWFLVDARKAGEVEWSDDDSVSLPEAVGGLSLVSPDGGWYAARPFAGTDAALSLHWAADGVWLMTGAIMYPDYLSGDVSRVDLKTGAQDVLWTDQTEHRAYVGAAGGVTVVEGYSQEVGGPYVVYGSGGVASPECAALTSRITGDFRTALAPDGRRVVCWGWRTDGKTDVGILDVQAPSAATNIDVFRLDTYHYQHVGWLSEDTFLLARLNDDGAVDAYFAYNVVSRTIEDFSLPFTPGTGLKLEAFDYEAQVYVSSSWESDSIDVHRASGEKIVTVTGGCADGSPPGWALSGKRLLTSCSWEAGAVTMFDLDTGTIIGTWPYGSELEVRADGYPQHAN